MSIRFAIFDFTVPARPASTNGQACGRLNSDDVPLLIMLQDIESVGRYALQFKWSDGHDTGIYSYTLLRGLCQCDLCQPVKPAEPKSRRLL